jgi:hypothetical protein
MPHVILYGHDEMLQFTRLRLLEFLGLTVSTASSLFELNPLLTAHSPQLIIVCYTVRADECDEVVALAQFRQPEIKVALLSCIVDRDSCHAPKDSHVLVQSPEEFSRSIRDILSLPKRMPKPMLKPVPRPN